MNTHKQIIYIGNIPLNCTETELIKLFAPYGKTTHIKIPLNYFDKTKQLDYAFIKLENLDDMIEAVKDLNNKLYKDQYLLLKIIDEI